VKASDSFGQQLTSALAVLLDTQAPVIAITSPSPGITVDHDLTITGKATDALSGLASLESAFDGVGYSHLAVNPDGSFVLTVTVAVDGSEDGPHTVHFRATDRVGNVSPVTDFAFTIDTCIALESAVVAQSGGSSAGKGSVTIDGCDATLREGDSFNVTLSQPITIPAERSTLSFDFSNPAFDSTRQGRVKDAFEVALVDASGHSLVPNFAANRDAFLNISEGQPASLGAWATLSGQTVTLDLSNLAPGTSVTLVFRLVNDDGDVNTSVDLGGVRTDVLAGPAASPGGQPPAPASSAPAVLDFAHMADVSPSIQPAYGRTSFDASSNVLYADVAARNAGQYLVESPLIVAIDHLSDPSVRVRGADGTTPDGLPYFDFSSLVSGGQLAASAITAARMIAFADPGGQPFTYDLTFLGHLNRAPEFTSTPNAEALVGKPYSYHATASDPEGDADVLTPDRPFLDDDRPVDRCRELEPGSIQPRIGGRDDPGLRRPRRHRHPAVRLVGDRPAAEPAAGVHVGAGRLGQCQYALYLPGHGHGCRRRSVDVFLPGTPRPCADRQPRLRGPGARRWPFYDRLDRLEWGRRLQSWELRIPEWDRTRRAECRLQRRWDNLTDPLDQPGCGPEIYPPGRCR
jgi:hypothetical protein